MRVPSTHLTRNRSSILSRLFFLQPGEETKTLLLYVLHFLFWLGLRWGDNASYTLFIDDRTAGGLSTMFIYSALLALAVGLIYNSIADRVSNEKLLVVILGLTILWLISVQVMLLSDRYGRSGGLVYPYFYLTFGVVADFTSLHLLNYTGDFYNIRAAKRALPLLLSAGFTGAIVAGISIRFLPLRFVPLAWICCLVGMGGLVYIIRRQLSALMQRIHRVRPMNRDRRRDREKSWANLLAGFRFMRRSTILRWLAFSTLVLVLLMKLLTFQASQVFEVNFAGDPEGFKEFNGTLGWVSNLAGLVLPLVTFRPILVRFGVGVTSLIFPLITILSVGILGYRPSLGTAILGRLTDRMVKKVFRNPSDALLYNSVPSHVRGRARGFVNGLVVPLGTLLTGLLLRAMQAGWFKPEQVAALGVLLGVTYVLVALRVRREYGNALAKMLAADDLSIFHIVSQAESEWLDPNTLNLLYERLHTERDDRVILFLADLLYDLRGRETLENLSQLAKQRSPQVRAGIIRLIGGDWVDVPQVHDLCLQGLRDPVPGVRHAAVMALAQNPTVLHDDVVLNTFLIRLDDPDETVLASVIPPLMASGDFFYVAPAVNVLSRWLSPMAPPRRRALGLRVLFKIGGELLSRTLVRYLDDPSPMVRRQATELIGHLTVRSSRKAFVQWGIYTLRHLLTDRDDGVRLAAIDGLRQISGDEANRALLAALGDPLLHVRRRACAAMSMLPRKELAQALESNNPFLAESGMFLLSRVKRRPIGRRARLMISEQIETLIRRAYHIYAQCALLHTLDTRGTYLLSASLREEADQFIERVAWLVGGLSDEGKARSIWRSLRSVNLSERANAVEMVETVTSPRIARLIAPLYDDVSYADLAHIGRDGLGIPDPTAWQILSRAWPQLGDEASLVDHPREPSTPDRAAWLPSIAMYALMELNEQDANGAWSNGDERLSSAAVLRAAQRMLDTDVPEVQETARLVLSRLNAVGDISPGGCETGQRPAVLTSIEKILALRDVPVFQEMIVDELRILASISERVVYAKGQQILAEGERGDALHIIVSGRVAIQCAVSDAPETVAHLATLGPREYFAEMSLFNEEPRSADAIALESTVLLLVRQAPLGAIIERYPKLALGLFTVLSQRLRRANEKLAQLQGGVGLVRVRA